MALVFSGVPPEGDTRATFHFAGTVDSGQTSDPLYLPRINRPASVAIHPGSSGRIEYTLSSREAVGLDEAHWLPWDEGDVTDPTASVLTGPVTALRSVAEGGDVDWEVMI